MLISIVTDCVVRRYVRGATFTYGWGGGGAGGGVRCLSVRSVTRRCAHRGSKQTLCRFNRAALSEQLEEGGRGRVLGVLDWDVTRTGRRGGVPSN